MEYEKLLDKAYSKIKVVTTSERFEMPEAEIYLEGNTTTIRNFLQICSKLRRNQEHVAKFLLRELATPGLVEGERLVLQRKLLSYRINEKIKAYVDEFVICRECKKPDTELLKEHKFLFLHWLACGAKHSVRAKIV